MYKILLPNFEGPFDLLLYFIKRDEINIYDIPIARITEEFLNYVRLMQVLDLELAGEFIVMASTLMYIKSQMLLPQKVDEDSGEIIDPRTQLVQKLLEYKKYKEASQELFEKSEKHKYYYSRKFFEADIEEAARNTSLSNASVFDLFKAFQKVIDRKSREIVSHEIKLYSVTVEEKRNHIMTILGSRKRISFFAITKTESRPAVIVTFLAILDLLRTRKIFIRQSEIFEDIIIGIMPNVN